RRRHTRLQGDWSSDVCSSDLPDREWERGGELNRVRDLCAGVLSAREHQDSACDADGTKQCFHLFLPGSRRPPSWPHVRWSVVARSEERRVGKECRCGWSVEQ